MTATISLADLKSEFGTYIGTNQKDILQKLLQKTESMKFMTTVKSADLEYRASQAVIDSIVQGFQKKWTPKSTPTFTPRSIPQRRHKADMEFYPDEVFDSWLGFLTDESKNRKDWPITRYIIEQLMLTKIAEDRELKLIAVGNYEAPVAETAQATGLSMDGFITLLEDAFTAGTSNINFITLDALTVDNIFDQIEDFADGLSEVYQHVKMQVFLSRSWYTAYHRKRRDLHGQDTNYEGSRDIVEGTNLILTPLPSMAGKDVILATPKANFIRLINRNEGASRVEVESVDRLIKVYADWHESVGFGIEEAIFAYVPDEASASA